MANKKKQEREEAREAHRRIGSKRCKAIARMSRPAALRHLPFNSVLLTKVHHKCMMA